MTILLQQHAVLHNRLSSDFADVYDVKNEAEGPNKGWRFIPKERTFLSMLKNHHHVRTITNAIKALSTPAQQALQNSGGGQLILY